MAGLMDLIGDDPVALQALSEISSYGGQGQPMSMSDAANMVEQRKTRQRQEMTDSALKQMISSGQIKLPPELIELIKSGVPASVAVEMWNTIDDNRRSQQYHDMMNEAFTGGAGGAGGGSPTGGGDRFSRLSTEKLRLIAGSKSPFAEGAKMELEQRIRDEDRMLDMSDKMEDEQRKDTRERRFLKIPGYDLGEEVLPDKSEAAKARKAASGLESMNTYIDEYIDMMKKHGPVSETFNPTLAKRYKQIQAQLALIGKEVFDLGALQEPDRQVLEDLSADPTGFRAQRLGGDEYVNMLQNAKRRANSYVSDRLSSMGYKKISDKKVFNVKGQKFTMEDIEHTAKKHGKSPEQVMKELGIQ